MNKRFTVSFLIAVLFNLNLLFADTVDNSQPKYLDTAVDFQTRASDLVSRMTLEEKISQLGNVSPAIDRLGINPYDWWNECQRGVAMAGTATVFPQGIAMAATFDRKLMYDVACMISDEARAKHHQALEKKDFGRYKGLTYWSPNINIVRDPRWGRGQETYGEDPYLTGQLGIQFVKGLQGDDPKYFKLIATPKHFAVHSGPEPERHVFNAVVNARDLWETYLPAFQDLIVKAKAYSMMGAYSRVDGQSASASWMLLQDILRKQWGFDGVVVSDCGAIRDIYKYQKMATPVEAAAIGLRNGCDLDCGDVYQAEMLNAVKAGLVSEGEIDFALYRLILAKMKLGMFDSPDMVPYSKIPFSVISCSKHDNAALEMARESIVLLKNENGFLPLGKKKLQKIAVIGPNADSVHVLIGIHSGQPERTVTILQGITKAVGPDCQILYASGSGLFDPNDSFQQAIEYTAQSDVTFFVGGLDPRYEAEQKKPAKIEGIKQGDKTKLELSNAQLALLKAMQDTGKPVVIVIAAGSSVTFNGLDQKSPAILMTWYSGQRGGDAVADVLFGNYNPAGRLPVTFYSSTAELPDFRDYSMSAGKGRTYRYYTGKPLYPFGHGLSFTKFEYADIKLSKKNIDKKGSFSVSAKVKNIGTRDGQEVVQLYVRDVESSVPMPIKQLRGFQRISLKKGQTQTVTFDLVAAEDLRYFNPRINSYDVEPGQFELQIGSSSTDIRLSDMILVQ